MSKKALAEVDVATAAHDAQVASVARRLNDPERLKAVALQEKEQARLLLLRKENAREELKADVAHLADLPPTERRQATLRACEVNLFAQLASEDEIIVAAYPNGGVSEYQEALSSEPISVWQFGLICAVHGHSKEEVWLRHKRAMIVLRDAAKLACKKNSIASVSSIFYDDDACSNFAFTGDDKIHPIERNGIAAATLVDPSSAVSWFAQTRIRASLLPSFFLRSHAPSPLVELVDEPEKVQGVRPREDAIVETLRSLYPSGRPKILRDEMARAVAASIKRPVDAKGSVFKRALQRLGWVKGRARAK